VILALLLACGISPPNVGPVTALDGHAKTGNHAQTDGQSVVFHGKKDGLWQWRAGEFTQIAPAGTHPDVDGPWVAYVLRDQAGLELKGPSPKSFPGGGKWPSVAHGALAYWVDNEVVVHTPSGVLRQPAAEAPPELTSTPSGGLGAVYLSPSREVVLWPIEPAGERQVLAQQPQIGRPTITWDDGWVVAWRRAMTASEGRGAYLWCDGQVQELDPAGDRPVLAPGYVAWERDGALVVAARNGCKVGKTTLIASKRPKQRPSLGSQGETTLLSWEEGQTASRTVHVAELSR